MQIDEKYMKANENQKAIDLLPEIIAFLASVAEADNHSYNGEQAQAALTQLADEAENLKFKIDYGY